MSLFGDIAGLAAINTAYNRLGSVGGMAQNAANNLAIQLRSDAAFKPFAVSSGTGRTYVDDRGSLDVRPTGMAANLQNALFRDALSNVGPAMGSMAATDLGFDFMGRSMPELDRQLATLDPTEQLATQSLLQSADFLSEAGMSPAERERAIFERIRAAQAPEEERQRLGLEERLASQGRLGVSTNLYGGTPEQLALAKAQSEARNTAMLQAMQQAQAERQLAGRLGAQLATTGAGLGQAAQDLLTGRQARGLQFAQSGLGMLSGQQALDAAQLQRALSAMRGGFIPEAQAANIARLGLDAGGMAQQAQQFGTGLFGEATMTGVDALLASGLGQANLLGNVGSGVLAAGASGSGEGGLFDFVQSIIDQISDVRLKENVDFVGRNQQGFNIYKWDWNDKANELGEFGSQVGVLAQELLETHPERVSVHDSGYYQVDYTGIWR